LILSDAILLLVAFVFGANNIGVIRSSFQYVSGKDTNLYLGAGSLAFAAGYFVEGSKVKATLTTSLTSAGGGASLVALATVLVLLTAFTLLKFPASISNAVLGAMVGVSLATNALLQANLVVSVIVAWLVAPLSAALIALLIHRTFLSAVRKGSLVSAATRSRYLGMVALLFTGYTLGANNLGTLLGFSSGPTVSILVVLVAIAGGLLFSRSVAWLLGWKMAVLSPSEYLSALLGASLTLWVYTELGIPSSLTQAIVGAMVVLSIERKPSIVNMKVLYEVLGSWVFLLLSSLVVAFLVSLVP
jgi:PiT family inorganic phosphate transporter